MARPVIDRTAVVESLLTAAEQLIRERGAVSVSIGDIAAACGMSPSNVYRYLPSREALWEAIAERWFRELNEAMDAVMALSLPAREKAKLFYTRRLAIKRRRFIDDPDLFRNYIALGERHSDVVEGYLDLADHNFSVIVSEAIAEGAIPDMPIDDAVKLFGLMTLSFCSPAAIISNLANATETNLALAIDVIFDGLCANADRTTGAVAATGLRLVG